MAYGYLGFWSNLSNRQQQAAPLSNRSGPTDLYPSNQKEDQHVRINKNGIDIDVKDDGESFKMKIDENGIQVRAKDNDGQSSEIDVDNQGVVVKRDSVVTDSIR